MTEKILKIEDFKAAELKFNGNGLIPVIAQDYKDNTILMQAFMNQESLEKTLELGQAVYYSRSRQELWHKGATSGNFQNIKALYFDCDQDALIIKVEQVGDIACHLGKRSCFFTEVDLSSLAWFKKD